MQIETDIVDVITVKVVKEKGGRWTAGMIDCDIMSQGNSLSQALQRLAVITAVEMEGFKVDWVTGN